MLFERLPLMALRFRNRFESSAEKFTRFTARIEVTSNHLRVIMDEVRQAKRKGDSRRVFNH